MVGIYGEKDLRGHQKSNGSIKVKNMKYIIQVSELLASRLEIEAETSEEAIQKVSITIVILFLKQMIMLIVQFNLKWLMKFKILYVVKILQ